MSIFNSMKCPRLFMYLFLLGYIHYIRLPVFYFSTFLYIFFPFLSRLLSVYHCPLFISLVYCKLPFPFQNIILNIFFFLPLSPSSYKSSLTSHSQILHCRLWQCASWAVPVALRAFCLAQGDTGTPCRVLRGESGISQDEVAPLHLLALCFLGPIPTGQFANTEGKAKEMGSCSSVHESNCWLFSTFSLVWSKYYTFLSSSCGHFQKGEIQSPGGVFLRLLMHSLRMAVRNQVSKWQ